MSQDAVVVLVCCLLLIMSFAYAGLTWWAAFLTALTVLLGAFEWLALRVTGKTLSQQFGELRKKNRYKADALLVLLLIATMALCYHLITMTPR